MLQKRGTVSVSLWRISSLIMCLLQAFHAKFFNVSGRLANERISLTHVLGCLRGRVRPTGGWGGGRGGDVALNPLLMASLSLKLPLSCRAPGLKQLEMAKLRVSV